MRYAAVLFPLLLPACASPAAEVEASAPAIPGGPASADAPEPDLVFTAPDGWEQLPEAMPGGLALYRLAGDDGIAVFVEVSSFAGENADVQKSIAYFSSCFEQPDGCDTRDVVQQVNRRVGSIPVHEFYISGTFTDPDWPGLGEVPPYPDWRLMAALIDTDDGGYFVKLEGPETAVRRWELSFRTFLNSIR